MLAPRSETVITLPDRDEVTQLVLHVQFVKN